MVRPFFDPETLRRMAGDKAYARGEDYAANDHICLLSAGAQDILAIAFGNLEYTVWIKRQAEPIEGRCTCPANEDAGFCKHLVATALVANCSLADGVAPGDAIGQVAERIGRIEKTQLVELVLELARSDWRVLRSLYFELGLDWDFDFDFA